MFLLQALIFPGMAEAQAGISCHMLGKKRHKRTPGAEGSQAPYKSLQANN